MERKVIYHRRKDNFTPEECDILVSAVASRRKIIMEKLSSRVSAQQKRAAWEAITTAVNSVAPCVRNVEEVKKRLSDLKMQLKRKEAERRRSAAQTGKLIQQTKPSLSPSMHITVLCYIIYKYIHNGTKKLINLVIVDLAVFMFNSVHYLNVGKNGTFFRLGKNDTF